MSQKGKEEEFEEDHKKGVGQPRWQVLTCWAGNDGGDDDDDEGEGNDEFGLEEVLATWSLNAGFLSCRWIPGAPSQSHRNRSQPILRVDQQRKAPRHFDSEEGEEGSFWGASMPHSSAKRSNTFALVWTVLTESTTPLKKRCFSTGILPKKQWSSLPSSDSFALM